MDRAAGPDFSMKWWAVFLMVTGGWPDNQLGAEESLEESPKITAIRNQVKTTGSGVNRSANAGDTVVAGQAAKTGEQGLAELKGKGETTARVGGKMPGFFLIQQTG